MENRNGQTEHDEGVSFAAFLRMLRRRAVVVILPILLVPGIAAAYSLSQQKEYATSALLLSRTTSGSDLKLSPSQDEEREAATNVSLATLGRVAERTAQVLGGGVNPGTVAGSIGVSAGGTANTIQVKATNHDPVLAMRIANAYAQQFIAFRRRSDRAAIDENLRSARAQILSITRRQAAIASRPPPPPGTDASRRQREERRSLQSTKLQLIDDLQKFSADAPLATGNLEFVQRAGVPGAPVSPKPVSSTLLGLALGVLLGIALAVLFELIDRRMTDSREVERILRRPILGAIPLSSALARNGGRRLGRRPRALRAGDKEAFHMLRANLRYFGFDEQVRSVVVTSAAPGEGKSTVAWNLTVAAAIAGTRTMLIEGELRKPTFVSEFNVPPGPGLSDVLAGDVDASEATHHLPLYTGPDGSEPGPTMDVMSAGNVPPNPQDLLESRRMEELIRRMEDEYELVVIDTPPLPVVSDAVPLLSRAGGVIVVSRLGSSTRDAANHLRRQLEGLDARVLGVVVNGIDNQDGYYGAAYGYAERYAGVSSSSG